MGHIRSGEACEDCFSEREGRQLGWHTDAEAVRKSIEGGCLESEATLGVGINMLSTSWDEHQLDSLEPG